MHMMSVSSLKETKSDPLRNMKGETCYEDDLVYSLEWRSVIGWKRFWNSESIKLTYSIFLVFSLDGPSQQKRKQTIAFCLLQETIYETSVVFHQQETYKRMKMGTDCTAYLQVKKLEQNKFPWNLEPQMWLHKLNRFQPNFKQGFLGAYADHPKHHQGHQPHSGTSIIIINSGKNSRNVIHLWEGSCFTY